MNSKDKSGTQTIPWFAGAMEVSSRRERRGAVGDGPVCEGPQMSVFAIYSGKTWVPLEASEPTEWPMEEGGGCEFPRASLVRR